ncbi:MAG: DUF1501 domain-containing protein [Planctomycetota bacterium]|nr:DUF1501 domain-containing protein [Planctomycetota bacterium]
MNASRRQMLQNAAAGFAMPALAGLLSEQAVAGSPVGLPRVAPKIKRVIFLFMYGGPSSIDTFDHKPQLDRDHGKPLPFDKPRVQFRGTKNLFGSPWKFRQYGESGSAVSELFPHVAQHVDKLTFVHSLHGSNAAHGGALLKIHTGSDTFVRPSMGAWISYGLSTENSNLPAFVTIDPTLNHGGVQNYGGSFLPAQHQGVRIHGQAATINDLQASAPAALQRRKLDLLQSLNQLQFSDVGPTAGLDARIRTFELAFRMQRQAPEALDLSQESKESHQLYGTDDKATSAFGRQCLLARRLAERGVRFIQCTHREGESITWDDHSNLVKHHPKLAHAVDKPIAGLLTDLHQRGLLEDTLVMWGGEFGRTPTAEGNDGRDHNPHGFTWWLAGGGLKPGFHFGATDEYGYYAVQDRVHIHDLHATLLHLMGLDHERLTYRYNGRDFRLTDVHGRVVSEILA